MDRTTWITSINKIRLDIMKNNLENLNPVESQCQEMAVTKLDEALLWLHKPAVDIHIDKVARGGTGPYTND